MDALNTKIKSILTEKTNKIRPENIKSGINILGINGSVTELKGETKTITPTTSQQTITPSSGKNGITQATVNAVTSSIDNNITAGNIKNNVSILGVTGNYTGNLTDQQYSDANDDLDTILEGTNPFYITNAESLFANNARLNQMTELLGMCKNVTIMIRMFSGCTNLTSLDLTNLIDTSELLQADNMFVGCSNLETLNLSTFKPTKIKSTGGMFGNCAKLTSLDLSNWDTTHITNIGTMFSNCTLLETIDFTGWNLSAVASNYSNTFANCPALTNNTLNEIMRILSTAHPSYGKTLKVAGLSSSQATTCTGLSNWSALQNAGWTTGY